MTSANSYEISAEIHAVSRLLCVLRESLSAEDRPTTETVQYALDGLARYLDRIAADLEA